MRRVAFNRRTIAFDCEAAAIGGSTLCGPRPAARSSPRRPGIRGPHHKARACRRSRPASEDGGAGRAGSGRMPTASASRPRFCRIGPKLLSSSKNGALSSPLLADPPSPRVNTPVSVRSHSGPAARGSGPILQAVWSSAIRAGKSAGRPIQGCPRAGASRRGAGPKTRARRRARIWPAPRPLSFPLDLPNRIPYSGK